MSYPFPALMEIAQAAGAAVMQVYRSEFDVQRKSDASPLTEADLAAHEVIRSGLEQLRPPPSHLVGGVFAATLRRAVRWRRYWLVDPLGRHEGIHRSQRRIHGQHRLDRGWTGAPRRGRGACFGAAVHPATPSARRAEKHQGGKVTPLAGRPHGRAA